MKAGKTGFFSRPLKFIAGIAFLFAGLWLVEVVSVWLDFGPTAIVVDAETGQPVEGAVALAQWHRAAAGGLFEGGSEALAKAEEGFSDKDGKIFIRGFWGVNIFKRTPRLTVYKPGYVIWDSKEICPVYDKRNDFDRKHRTVKLLKFDTEAARWLKEKYDVGRGGPRAMQGSFFSHCYDSEAAPKFNITFRNIFFKYEKPFDDAEEMLRREKAKSK